MSKISVHSVHLWSSLSQLLFTSMPIWVWNLVQSSLGRLSLFFWVCFPLQSFCCVVILLSASFKISLQFFDEFLLEVFASLGFGSSSSLGNLYCLFWYPVFFLLLLLLEQESFWQSLSHSFIKMSLNSFHNSSNCLLLRFRASKWFQFPPWKCWLYVQGYIVETNWLSSSTLA